MASRSDKRRGFPRFLLPFFVLPLLGCPPVVQPPTGKPTTFGQVLDWTLGRQHLASTASPDAILVLIPKDKLVPKPTPKPTKRSDAATALSDDSASITPDVPLTECLRATSVLPAPQDDGRIFLAVDGAVHAIRPPSKTVTILGNEHPFGHVDALLAVRKVEGGLEIVAQVQVENKADPEIHLLVVDAGTIVRSNIADLGSPSFQNESALFKAYTVPHCDRDGKECLEISKVEDTNVIDIAVKGAKSTQLGEVKGARDAVWSPANDGSVYVLKTCGAP